MQSGEWLVFSDETTKNYSQSPQSNNAHGSSRPCSIRTRMDLNITMIDTVSLIASWSDLAVGCGVMQGTPTKIRIQPPWKRMWYRGNSGSRIVCIGTFPCAKTTHWNSLWVTGPSQPLCEPRLRQIRPERVANAVKPFEDQVAYVKGTKLRKYFKDNIVANGTTYQLLSPKALFAALRAQQDLQDTTRTIPTVWSFPATPDEVYDNNTLHCHTLTVALCAGEQMESLKHDCRLRSSASRHACWNVSA
jgi:hypothetical protein